MVWRQSVRRLGPNQKYGLLWDVLRDTISRSVAFNRAIYRVSQDDILWDDFIWLNLLLVNLLWDNLWGKPLGCHVGEGSWETSVRHDLRMYSLLQGTLISLWLICSE